ncbi:MAG: tetratricopeptide repeat protein [Desulfobacteraceae bacterium]|nr:tetratricopeptide repeat protein [Desulfobacteraceae bacterium]
MNLIENKFTSKEVDFLKKNSKDEVKEITPPEFYLSDILQNETKEINSFKKRLQSTQLIEDKFICLIFKISSIKGSPIKEKKSEDIDALFEKSFHTLLQQDRGIWQRIDKNIYALAFWDYDNKNKAKSILKSLTEKMSTAMDINICVGASWFPSKDCSKFDSFDNAVKALDHAAFFGENSFMFFDAISIHIYGDRLYQLGHIEEASIEYQKGLELDETNIILINSLGVCYGLIDMLDKAKDEFKKVLRISSNEIMSIYNLGLVYDLTNENKKAIQYLKKANSIDNNIFEIELLLGRMLYKTDEPKRALYHLKKALKLKSESASALRITGEILLEQNKLPEAVSNFSKAIKLNPSDSISLSGLAKAYEIQNKNIDIALSFAKKSVKLDPDNPIFKTRLTEIYIKKELNQASCQTQNDQKIKSA